MRARGFVTGALLSCAAFGMACNRDAQIRLLRPDGQVQVVRTAVQPMRGTHGLTVRDGYVIRDFWNSHGAEWDLTASWTPSVVDVDGTPVLRFGAGEPEVTLVARRRRGPGWGRLQVDPQSLTLTDRWVARRNDGSAVEAVRYQGVLLLAKSEGPQRSVLPGASVFVLFVLDVCADGQPARPDKPARYEIGSCGFTGHCWDRQRSGLQQPVETLVIRPRPPQPAEARPASQPVAPVDAD